MATTIPELLKNYTIDVGVAPGERLADFLALVAEELPYAFVDKRICAKVAFAQKRTPSEESDYVKKKLPGVTSTVKRILMKKYAKDLHSDRVEGIRATVDDADIAQTTRRAKRNRIGSSIRSFELTDSLIDVRNLRGAIRKEVLETRKNHQLLTQYMDLVPLLPPKKGDE